MEEYFVISSQESCLGGEIIFGATNVAFLISDSSKPTKPPTERALKTYCSSCNLSFPTISPSTNVKKIPSITIY